MPVKVIISDRIRFKKGLISKKAMLSRYDRSVYDEVKCDKCDNLDNRHNEICDTCPAFVGRYRFFSQTEAKQGIWSVPQGDIIAVLKKLRSKHPDIIVKDTRKAISFDNDIKFTGRLYKKGEVDEEGRERANQIGILRKWWKHKHGVIQAAPRTGKCLTGDTMLNTGRGWLEMRELIAHSGYHSSKGKVSSYKGTEYYSHLYKEKSSTVYIETRNGVTLRCTPEHPVLVITEELEFKWRKAKALQLGDMLVSKTRQHKAIWGKSDISIAEAKLAGYLIANGRGNSFSSKDEQVVRDFKRCAKKVFASSSTFKIRQEQQSSNATPNYFMVGVHDLLIEKGLYFKGSRTKEIPLSIRQAPREVMQAFLDSYFACDSHNNGKLINLITAGCRLSKQLQTILFMGFDIRCWRRSIHSSARNSNTPRIRKYWCLQPSTADVTKFLALFPNAKVAKCKKLSSGNNRQDHYSRPLAPIRQFLLKTYGRYDSGLEYNNGPLFRYLDGSLKTWKFPFKGKWRGMRQNMSRAKFESIDWRDQLADLKKLDKYAYLKFKKYLALDPALEIVARVKNYTKKVDVYDITVPKTHSFYANGVVSHNTVMATAAYCHLGQKTVIIASQKEWLKQFYETATGRTPPTYRGAKIIKQGKKAQRRKAVTNIRKLQRETGKEIIRFVEKFADLEKSTEYYDVILMTYQALMKDPSRILKYLNGRYSMCVVDEQHKGNAHAYMKVLAQLNVKHRLSLSATTKRKDSRDIFGRIIMGPVVARSVTNALVPHIYFEPTGFTMKKPIPKMWPTVYKRACYDLKRNQLIVKKVFDDLRAGHKVILVPVDYIEHIKGLVKMINRKAAKLSGQGQDWPITLAKPFHRAVDRDETIEWVDTKEWDVPNKRYTAEERGPAPRVLVARSSMIKEGIDFARPTCIHLVLPMSANSRAGGPAFYQLINRVCTPIPGKKQPIARIYVDENIGMFQGAISGLLWHEIFPNSTLKQPKGRYYLSKQQYQNAKNLTTKRRQPLSEAKLFSGSWV